MTTTSDPIADFLTRLKNASRAGQEACLCPYSKVKEEIARILKEEGYIWSYEVDRSGKFPVLRLKTKFIDGSPVLTDLKRMSKPGRRSYVPVAEIPRVRSGLGISILSTSKGVMTGSRAKRENIGGELLAFVW
jgi:small subunit ribosomal protein S8